MLKDYKAALASTPTVDRVQRAHMSGVDPLRYLAMSDYRTRHVGAGRTKCTTSGSLKKTGRGRNKATSVVAAATDKADVLHVVKHASKRTKDEIVRRCVNGKVTSYKTYHKNKGGIGVYRATPFDM